MKNFIFNMVIIANFAMLAILTVAQKPFEKAVDSLYNKHKLEATAKVCTVLYNKRSSTADEIRKVFINGCAWEVMISTAVAKGRNEKEKAEIYENLAKKWNLGEGEYYGQVTSHCAHGAVMNVNEIEMSSSLIDEAMSALQCDEAYEELRKYDVSD